MRWAIVSDIHANLQAWMAVYSDILKQHVDRIVSLGDLVGYGPNPVEVCLLTRKCVDVHLMGNHDAAVCGRVGLDNWNARARQMVEWSRQRVPDAMRQWLGQHPYTYSAVNACFGHSEFSRPEAFYYITKPCHADYSWQAVEAPLLFCGHSHRPALYVRGNSGVVHQLAPQPFVCESEKRYLVNVGSVGYPRDVRDQACYCLFDTDARTVFWRRVPFDYETYRLALVSVAPPFPSKTAS